MRLEPIRPRGEQIGRDLATGGACAIESATGLRVVLHMFNNALYV